MTAKTTDAKNNRANPISGELSRALVAQQGARLREVCAELERPGMVQELVQELTKTIRSILISVDKELEGSEDRASRLILQGNIITLEGAFARIPTPVERLRGHTLVTLHSDEAQLLKQAATLLEEIRNAQDVKLSTFLVAAIDCIRGVTNNTIELLEALSKVLVSTNTKADSDLAAEKLKRIMTLLATTHEVIMPKQLSRKEAEQKIETKTQDLRLIDKDILILGDIAAGKRPLEIAKHRDIPIRTVEKRIYRMIRHNALERVRGKQGVYAILISKEEIEGARVVQPAPKLRNNVRAELRRESEPEMGFSASISMPPIQKEMRPSRSSRDLRPKELPYLAQQILDWIKKPENKGKLKEDLCNDLRIGRTTCKNYMNRLRSWGVVVSGSFKYGFEIDEDAMKRQWHVRLVEDR